MLYVQVRLLNLFYKYDMLYVLCVRLNFQGRLEELDLAF